MLNARCGGHFVRRLNAGQNVPATQRTGRPRSVHCYSSFHTRSNLLSSLHRSLNDAFGGFLFEAELAAGGVDVVAFFETEVGGDAGVF